jgi:hypothetical protein
MRTANGTIGEYTLKPFLSMKVWSLLTEFLLSSSSFFVSFLRDGLSEYFILSAVL